MQLFSSQQTQEYKRSPKCFKDSDSSSGEEDAIIQKRKQVASRPTKNFDTKSKLSKQQNKQQPNKQPINQQQARGGSKQQQQISRHTAFKEDEDEENEDDEDEDEDEDDEDENEDEDDGEGDNDSEQERVMKKEQLRAIREQLSTVPFGVILEKYQEADEEEEQEQTRPNKKRKTNSGEAASTQKKDKKKKKNKDAPTEVTARKPVSKFRVVVPGPPKRVTRDPRFDSLSGGEFKAHSFAKNYAFLDKLRAEEIKSLKQSKVRNAETKSQIDALNTQMQVNKQAVQTQKYKQKFYKEQMERAKNGLQPRHFNPAAMKRMQLEEKFDELNKGSKLEDFMAKRRKKQEQKQKIHMPRTRRNKD